MAKRALLIGINRYRIPGADLRGCINDVKNLQGVLATMYGFAKADITTLLDYDATKKNMQSAIRALIASGKKGDTLLLHYSGHGANVPDANGDEADKRDEILCPTDLDWKDPLTDDWLRATIDKVKLGVNLTIVMDCCHSGSNTRAILPPDAKTMPRYLPNPWDIMAAESGRKLKGKVAKGMRSAATAQRRRSNVAIVAIPEVLVTGCRDTQTSADAYIAGSYNGALTYHLVAALKAAKGTVKNRALHADVIARLAKGKFDQTPQLEGAKAHLDAEFLAPIV